MNPKDWADAFATFVGALAGLKGHLLSGIVTCMMGCGIYICYSTIQLGSLRQAFVVAMTSQEERAAHEAAEKAARNQHSLAYVDESNRIIQGVLEGVLTGPSGNASRIRVAVVHDGDVSFTTRTHLMKYDVIASASERGRTVGPNIVNAPISEMQDVLGDMLANRCKFMDVASLTESNKKVRLQTLGVTSFLACPI